MNKIELKALGKINLALDVTGRRPNGYHDVKMVMQTVWLYDKVKLEKVPGGEITVRTNLKDLPVDRTNLAYRAAALLAEEYDIRTGVSIFLEKHIPVAAGMAGGSTNAAAVLIGMNELFELGLSKQDLMDRGVKLGADVPYCIMQGTALAEGIGEILSPLPAMPKCYILLAKPPVSVSTKMVYEKLDSYEGYAHPDVDGVIEGLEKNDLNMVASRMGNILELVTAEAYPVIEEIKTKMNECGALNSMMSGSGPTVFGIFDDKGKAKNAEKEIREAHLAGDLHVVNVHGAGRR